MKDLNASNSDRSNGHTNNFFLVGFMGSGKTHWGKKWAAANQLSFVDLDDVIEKKEGKTIRNIFETSGEDHFRKIEAASLRECATLQNTIVACGGGTPCFYENMQWMNEHGTTIYIASTTEQILQRVRAEQDKRPLLKKMSLAELSSFIEEKLQERAPVYTQAQITVQSGQVTEDSFTTIISTHIS